MAALRVRTSDPVRYSHNSLGGAFNRLLGEGREVVGEGVAECFEAL